MTEQQGQIHLTSLAPGSGVALWTQPVCILGRSSEMDADRQLRACAPVRSNGVVIFPTNTGLVVALDLVQRRLLWVTHVDDLPNGQQSRGRGEYLPPTQGYAGFASGLVMAAGRVVYLPPRSTRVSPPRTRLKRKEGRRSCEDQFTAARATPPSEMRTDASSQSSRISR